MALAWPSPDTTVKIWTLVSPFPTDPSKSLPEHLTSWLVSRRHAWKKPLPASTTPVTPATTCDVRWVAYLRFKNTRSKVRNHWNQCEINVCRGVLGFLSPQKKSTNIAETVYDGTSGTKCFRIETMRFFYFVAGELRYFYVGREGTGNLVLETDSILRRERDTACRKSET
jgi:hypothetical protein